MKIIEDGFIFVDRDDIFRHLKNRPPLLMIDEAYVKPGESVHTEKVLKGDEWFFECHFPGNPMMPGVLQLESMFNCAALPIKMLEGNEDKTTNISQIKNVHYRRHILPGETIKVVVDVRKYRRGLGFMHGEILVKDEICCEADFVLVMLDDVVEVGDR